MAKVRFRLVQDADGTARIQKVTTKRRWFKTIEEIWWFGGNGTPAHPSDEIGQIVNRKMVDKENAALATPPNQYEVIYDPLAPQSNRETL